MKRAVALTADLEPLLHLFAGEILLEPLVAVQRSGDAMMKVIRWFTTAEFTCFGFRFVRLHCSSRRPFWPLAKIPQSCFQFDPILLGFHQDCDC